MFGFIEAYIATSHFTANAFPMHRCHGNLAVTPILANTYLRYVIKIYVAKNLVAFQLKW